MNGSNKKKIAWILAVVCVVVFAFGDKAMAAHRPSGTITIVTGNVTKIIIISQASASASAHHAGCACGRHQRLSGTFHPTVRTLPCSGRYVTYRPVRQFAHYRHAHNRSRSRRSRGHHGFSFGLFR